LGQALGQFTELIHPIRLISLTPYNTEHRSAPLLSR